MKKILFCLVLLSIVLLSGCGEYREDECGYFTSKYHEEDARNLGQELCELKYNCSYGDFEDICGTGRNVDIIYCDCNLKTITID